MTSLFEAQAPRPLADRLRPTRLDEVIGQDHLLNAARRIGQLDGIGGSERLDAKQAAREAARAH